MLELLRTWLNGKRDYYQGVALYAECGDNETLKKLFSRGPTAFTKERLPACLMEIFQSMKEQETDAPSMEAVTEQPRTPVPQQEPATVKNQELYDAVKRDADKQYKEVMNSRAVLFAQIRNELSEPNTTDRISYRAPQAIAIVTGFNKLSKMYETAAFVKEHGHLPAGADNSDEDFEHLPDNLVKGKLDNLRKAYSKLKLKEPTAERVELMQQHLVNIDKLQKRWDYLKSTM